MFVYILRRRLLMRLLHVFFLMIRRPPRSTLDRSSAASDVYKRQVKYFVSGSFFDQTGFVETTGFQKINVRSNLDMKSVSYTHLRAHETVLDLVCRLLLEKKNK